MHSHRSLAGDFPSLSIPSRGTVRAFGKPFVAQRLGWSTTPSADFCHAVKAGFPAFSRCRFRVGDTWQISRGKTRILPRIDAGFTKCSPFADGGLGAHVPTGPGCTSLAGRVGPQAQPFASHKQSSGLFVHGLSLISGFCSSSRDFALGLPTAPRLAATHLLFG